MSVYNDTMQLLSIGISSSTPARDKILFTAHDLFYQNGIRATGIDRLIKDAQVSKRTFYRYFPSKEGLIIEYLKLRHRNWLAWFSARIGHYGSTSLAISHAINEWFACDGFRGCAFLNSVGELGEEMPAVNEITRRHKQSVVDLIHPIVGCKAKANAIGVAIDGAILRAQFDSTSEYAEKAFEYLINQFAE